MVVPTSTAPGEARASYYQFALPTTTCTFTDNTQAAWVMINAPVNVAGNSKGHSYRLRLKGRMRASDVAPVVLGEREVELFVGIMSVARVHRPAQ